jgi:hypothetical protein
MVTGKGLLPPPPADIAEQAGEFVGRSWVGDRIAGWLTGGGPVLLITGEPGAGKTMVAAQAVAVARGKRSLGHSSDGAGDRFDGLAEVYAAPRNSADARLNILNCWGYGGSRRAGWAGAASVLAGLHPGGASWLMRLAGTARDLFRCDRTTLTG